MGRSKDDNGNDENVVKRVGLDRREFGKILVAGVGGLSLGTVAGAQESKPPSAGKQLTEPDVNASVVIVGAGLSGLIAARQLKKYNLKNVTILEARKEVGGRMSGQSVKITTDKGETETGYVDFGGQWVGDTQTSMLQLLADLKIEKFISYEKGQSIQSFDPKIPGLKPEVTVFDGDVSNLAKGECKAPDHFPGNTAACNKLLFPACGANENEQNVWLRGLLEISKDVPCDSPWAAVDAANLDRTTFQDYLDGEKAWRYTQWLPAMVSRIGGSGGFEPDQVSLLHMAWTQHVGPQSETPEKWLINGGAGQIPEKLRAQLVTSGVVFRMSTPVRTIARGPYVVSVDTDGLGVTYAADRVIVAIPPPLRRKISFPDLPTDYVGFMYGSTMGSMSKVHAIYDHAFWREQCLSGSAAGNLETCEFIADSSSEDGKPGILTSFIAADRNKSLRHASKEEVKELVLKDYVYYFGLAAASPKEFYYKNWDNEMWTGGAFTSYVPPHVWTRYGEYGWRRPYNNVIFWAGTETADRWPGYFDGAIRAGIRAANEVLVSLGFTIKSEDATPTPDCPKS